MVEETSARHFGRVFDEVAAQYDRSRPSYPDDLIAEACEVAGLGRYDPVLELGCGTGQLTRSLLARGFRVLAVEPGKQLVALAAQNLAGSGAVEFVNARFEDATLPRNQFRAVFSAAAFHWIDPDVSWEKAARMLAPGGTLALIQYCGLQEERSIRDQEELLSGLARIAPEIATDWPTYRDLDATVAGAEQRRENISEVWAWLGCHDVARRHAGSLFSAVHVAVVPTLLEQTADELNGLLSTTSGYQRLSLQQRQALEGEHVAMYKRLGRPIRSSTVAVLVTARRTNEV
ncbi:MAG: class I SAM-dependent methyltransferase [Solirubrobacteraceae bacterium]|jgi:SAM-dependent methyltransferase